MKRTYILIAIIFVVSSVSLVFSGIALSYSKVCSPDKDSLAVILSFVSVGLAAVGFGNFLIIREANNNFTREIDRAKEYFKSEIAIVRDLNRPPF